MSLGVTCVSLSPRCVSKTVSTLTHSPHPRRFGLTERVHYLQELDKNRDEVRNGEIEKAVKRSKSVKINVVHI